MSRGPHFSSNAKAEHELGYVATSAIDQAIHDAVEDFVARGTADGLKRHGTLVQDPDEREENHETKGRELSRFQLQ